MPVLVVVYENQRLVALLFRPAHYGSPRDAEEPDDPEHDRYGWDKKEKSHTEDK